MTLRNALDKPIIEQRKRSGTRAAGARIQLGATSLADLLAPDGVDRRRNHMVQVGDSCITTLELRGFPHTLDLAWLSDPTLG
ncbi:MAG TPA: conjugal transfer protein TraC, partial [Roseiflexaceae bacterium]